MCELGFALGPYCGAHCQCPAHAQLAVAHRTIQVLCYRQWCSGQGADSDVRGAGYPCRWPALSVCRAQPLLRPSPQRQLLAAQRCWCWPSSGGACRELKMGMTTLRSRARRQTVLVEDKAKAAQPYFTNANFPVDPEGRTYHLGTKVGPVCQSGTVRKHFGCIHWGCIHHMLAA